MLFFDDFLHNEMNQIRFLTLFFGITGSGALCKKLKMFGLFPSVILVTEVALIKSDLCLLKK